MFNPEGRLRQCHRCQSFGGVFSGCQREPRWLKCGEKHLIAKANCHFEGPQFPPKCANCQGEHSWNFKECPIFQKHIELFSKRNSRPEPETKAPENRIKDFPPLPKRQFPHKIRNQQRQTIIDSSTVEDIKSIFNVFKNVNFQEISNTIKSTSQKLKRCNDTWSKILLLIESAMTLFSTPDGCTP